MDGSRFDSLAKALAGDLNRRGFSRLLASGLALAAPAATVDGKKDKKKPNKCNKMLKVCGRKCVNIRSDPRHCGGCRNRCARGWACLAGQCRCDQPACFREEWNLDNGPAGEYWVTDIAGDGGNLLYVLHSGRVLKFRIDGTFIMRWGKVNNGTEGIAADDQGNVYVTDNWEPSVLKFSGDGALVAKWTNHLEFPKNIAVGPNGDVYVEDGNAIKVFDADGTLLRQWEPTGFRSPPAPYQISVDAAGYVYIPASKHWQVGKFTPDGELVWVIGESGTGHGEFDGPSGVAFDAKGRVHVAEWGNDRVQVFDADGSFLFVWGEDRFFSPKKLIIAGDQSVFVAGKSFSYIDRWILGEGYS